MMELGMKICKFSLVFSSSHGAAPLISCSFVVSDCLNHWLPSGNAGGCQPSLAVAVVLFELPLDYGYVIFISRGNSRPAAVLGRGQSNVVAKGLPSS